MIPLFRQPPLMDRFSEYLWTVTDRTGRFTQSRGRTAGATVFLHAHECTHDIDSCFLTKSSSIKASVCVIRQDQLPPRSKGLKRVFGQSINLCFAARPASVCYATRLTNYPPVWPVEAGVTHCTSVYACTRVNRDMWK